MSDDAISGKQLRFGSKNVPIARDAFEQSAFVKNSNMNWLISCESNHYPDL